VERGGGRERESVCVCERKRVEMTDRGTQKYFLQSQFTDLKSDCVLQCVAVCCSVLQLQRVAVCCSVLQCVAVRCSILQCVAVCCSVLWHAMESKVQRDNITISIFKELSRTFLLRKCLFTN